MVPGKRPRPPSFSKTLPPIQKEIPDQVPVRYFLELCRFCKKNLPQEEDVFMYGYLGAFCSKECRAKQMAWDIFMELLRHEAKPKKESTSKDEGLERITTSSLFFI